MDVLKFIVAHIDDIALIISAIGAVIYLVKHAQTKILKQTLFGLVTEAEQMYGDGTGSLKYSVVADWLYSKIPNHLKIFFTAKDIEKMIEVVLEEAKEKWEKNNKLQNYINQE